MPGDWSDRLAGLQQEGVLTGFALLTGQGACQPATGPFAELLSPQCAERRSEVQQLAAPFFSSEQAPTSLKFCGTKLVVVQQAPGSFCAVSRRRELGVAARHLPVGVLLVSFRWPVPAQQVVSELDKCCAPLIA